MRYRALRESPDVLEQAADWFLRIREGLTQAEFNDWRAWLSAHREHMDAFDRVNRLWADSGKLTELPWPDDTELGGDEYDGEAPLRTGLVANASFSDGRRPNWRFAAAASVVIALIFSLAAWQRLSDAAVSYATENAEHRVIELLDGSEITMGGKSKITVAYTPESRLVELAYGEAYFSVIGDAARPFIVSAGSRTVHAIGTAFNVNIGVRDIRVTVVEGEVRIEGPAPVGGGSRADVVVTNVSSGYEVDFNTASVLGELRQVDADIAAAWRDGHPAYVETSLESVIADINRYTEKELIIGDDATKDLVFTGTVFHREIDDWLVGLEKAFPIRVVPVKGHGVLLIASEP